MTHKILVANGSSNVCDLLTRAIRCFAGDDVQADYVHDGEAAIEALTESPDGTYSCAVLCRPLEETSAWEALQIIRDAENGWPDLPVVIASPRPSIDGAMKAWHLGADEYLCAEPDLIVRTVKRMVGGVRSAVV